MSRETKVVLFFSTFLHKDLWTFLAAFVGDCFEFCNIAKYVETFITPIKLSDALTHILKSNCPSS